MLSETKFISQTGWVQATSPEPITPYTLTLTVAYLQYYTPKRVGNGRLLAVQHLRTMAAWINQPTPRLRSLRNHKILALHLALLRAARFIPRSGRHLLPQPTITGWFFNTYRDRLQHLLDAISDADNWQQSLIELSLETVLNESDAVYLQQSLARQQDIAPRHGQASIAWWGNNDNTLWYIQIPATLPLWLHFDLRQLGNWAPDQPLVCTPLSIASAVQHGYSADTIRRLLETAAQKPLTPTQQRQLQQWSRRSAVYKLRTVHLLTTTQPQEMAAVLRHKRLRSTFIEQISPRHAIVSQTMAPLLEKWLAARAFPLAQQAMTKDDRNIDEATAVQWLGLRLLIGLGELIPLPYPAPYRVLATLDAQLAGAEKTELETMASKLLNDLGEVIRGRDAFFPAQEAVSETMLTTLQQALYDETTLAINYQPLGSHHPSWREIQPLRLEQRGALYYLSAYCLRTETNLTFRLDRVQGIKEAVGNKQ